MTDGSIFWDLFPFLGGQGVSDRLKAEKDCYQGSSGWRELLPSDCTNCRRKIWVSGSSSWP